MDAVPTSEREAQIRWLFVQKKIRYKEIMNETDTVLAKPVLFEETKFDWPN